MGKAKASVEDSIGEGKRIYNRLLTKIKWGRRLCKTRQRKGLGSSRLILIKILNII